MRLPNFDAAVIDEAKIRDYLLSRRHPVGRFKARFFASLGFAAEGWQLFERALREQHLTRDADPAETDAYGQAFTIRGMLEGPTGASAEVISVWFVRIGEDHPRFVTAYPGETK